MNTLLDISFKIISPRTYIYIFYFLNSVFQRAELCNFVSFFFSFMIFYDVFFCVLSKKCIFNPRLQRNSVFCDRILNF